MRSEFDRWITLLVFRPLLRATFSRRPGIPVLMYHSISDDPEPGIAGYYRTCTRPRLFAQHLEWLRAKGYQAVNLETALATSASSADKRVVITFDDGFRDFYTEAAPLLARSGFGATVYLPTAFIGEQRHTFKGRDCLTWNEVTELHQGGIQFGSHTVNHPQLHDLPWSEVEGELRGSKAHLEDRLQAPVLSFAHPYAFPQEDQPYVHRLKGTLQSLGYRDCVTTMVGRINSGDDSYHLRRLPINSGDDQALFHAKLEGSYDWLAPLQLGMKRLKSRQQRRKQARSVGLSCTSPKIR